jgi:hypothetical protein
LIAGIFPGEAIIVASGKVSGVALSAGSFPSHQEISPLRLVWIEELFEETSPRKALKSLPGKGPG